MRILLDTQLAVRGAIWPERLSETARDLMRDGENSLHFSLVAIWEVAIKFRLGRTDFPVEPRRLRLSLIEGGFKELGISGDHVIESVNLPPIHRDPFDRLLVAQSNVENIMLLTMDKVLACYPASVKLV